MAKIRRSIELPKDLYEKIKTMADAETRSINGQIVYLLTDIVERKEARPKLVVMSEAKK